MNLLPLLLITLGIGLCGALIALAVYTQWTLFRGFDLSIAGAVTIAAELNCALSTHASFQGMASVILSLIASVACNFVLLWFWNGYLLSLEQRAIAVGRMVLVASLCLTIALSGAIVLLRGPGTRSPAWPSAKVALSAGGYFGASQMVALLSTVLLGLLAVPIVKSRHALRLRLWAENRDFAREVGVEQSALRLLASGIGGVSTGIVGSWIATSSGSTIDIGLGHYLLGAGGALLFSMRTPMRALMGGAALALAHFGLQLFVSPSVAQLLVFAAVAVLLLVRGSSRDSEELR
jgi:branched-subunit amino acid ABC-type transport system permease component